MPQAQTQERFLFPVKIFRETFAIQSADGPTLM
jgi:hypothetical protein